MFLESVLLDVRYALRGFRRSPLFAISVASTIGLGLGILCSAVTLLNAYVLRPIDLPEPRSLFALSWDTATVRRHGFTLADVAALRESAPLFANVTAAAEAVSMQDGVLLTGRLVTSNYFRLLGGRAAIGRMITDADAPAPGGAPVVVLSDLGWRTRFGANPAIVGTQIALGRERFDVIGVMPASFALPGDEGVAFWVPLTMARAFGVAEPWSDASYAGLVVTTRVRPGVTESQLRAAFDTWLKQRFQPGSASAPVSPRVESRATRLPWTRQTATLFAVIVSAFALVLLVACANVTNLMLARGFGRQREIAMRLSLGGSRQRIVRQLVIESLVLGVPAALVGLGLTTVIARVFPTLIVGTFPLGGIPVEAMLMPLTLDLPVLVSLCLAAIAAAVVVSFAPALRVTRANLVRASKGEAALDTRRSRLRSSLVAIQIGACVVFLVGAFGFVERTKRFANPVTGLSYELVSSVRTSPRLQERVAMRLRNDPAVERVAAASRPPLVGPLQTIRMVASGTRIEQTVGFMVVSPDYFPMFGVTLTGGRMFTQTEADDRAAVALVSEATARTLWPGRDPIGQTLELIPSPGESVARPPQTSVRIVGVTKDVVTGVLLDGVDRTCVYFPTGFRAPEALSILVRARTDLTSVKTAVTAAVDEIEPEAPFQLLTILEVFGVMAWVMQAFSVTASVLSVIGLVLAFSGTYGVVAFLVAQRTREFGIRMAIGATVRQIVAGILGETVRTGAIGLCGGAAVSLALMRAASRISIMPQFALAPYAIAGGIVLLATVVAALLPSIRAGHVDPSRALRAE